MKQWNTSHQHFSEGLLTSQKQVAACDLQKWKLTPVSTGNLETDDVARAGNVKRPCFKISALEEAQVLGQKGLQNLSDFKIVLKKLKMLWILQKIRTLSVQDNHIFLPRHLSLWLFLKVEVVWWLVWSWVPAGGYLSRHIFSGRCDLPALSE